ncbi:MAG: dienelactone hydrolase family protein [Planctomycetota bacterium]|nr:MAG: dienelactone hydrolase family protein [Planctomycetota bacterium]
MTPRFIPGEEVRVDVDNKHVGGDHFLVYVPTSYADDCNWPVIFVYHGMNAQPTTWPFRQATHGKGFIIIGMGYVPQEKGKMTKSQYVNYMGQERRSALEVKRQVSKHLKIDENRLFVGGFSKGGWHGSAMIESSPKVWAGAVIFAAGRSRSVNLISTTAAKGALRDKPIYIGAGEKDANLHSAQKAAQYYKRLGAKVTFEEFKGCGHGFDPTGSDVLYNWLIANSAVEDDKSDETDEKAD